ncbi:Ribosome-binding factor A [Sesbania bispinosa]|nr:Ribosome-binding factor A [Sesbania bispinosa]
MTYLLNHPALIPSPWRYHFPATTTSTSIRITPIQSQSHGWALTGKAVVGSGSTIRCMANPRRVKMVAKQIRRELSDMLLTDKILQYAVLPEASLGADRYLSSLTTITDVEVSADLQVVKVYVSVFGDERGKEVAIAGLKSKAKYVRSELGKRMKLRLTPEIRFLEDESFERGSRATLSIEYAASFYSYSASTTSNLQVIAILDKIKNEKSTESKNQEQLDDDDNWDGEDPDEGIIYVE